MLDDSVQEKLRIETAQVKLLQETKGVTGKQRNEGIKNDRQINFLLH